MTAPTPTPPPARLDAKDDWQWVRRFAEAWMQRGPVTAADVDLRLVQVEAAALELEARVTLLEQALIALGGRVAALEQRAQGDLP